MEEKKVSIILTTYKRPNLIDIAIENVKKQTYKNIEIIVVNDNGIENKELRKQTYEKIKKYLKEIRYIELDSNLGGALARNKGIEIATGDYISFFDDDDEYYPNKIEKQVKVLNKYKTNEKIAFVKCEIEFRINNKYIGVSDTKYLFLQKNLLKAHILNLHGIVGTTSFLFKADILKKIGGFVEVSIRQEYSLILELLLNGYSGIHIDDSLVILNGDGESITRTKNEKKVIDMEKVLYKRLNCGIYLSKNEREKIQIDHYLDLADWYCEYKRLKSFSYIMKVIYNSKNIDRKIIKLIFKNILGEKYRKIRKVVKGY